MKTNDLFCKWSSEESTILCRSEEESATFVNMFHDNGIRWRGREGRDITYWNECSPIQGFNCYNYGEGDLVVATFPARYNSISMRGECVDFADIVRENIKIEEFEEVLFG